MDYNQTWKLLVSVCLVARCTDAQVNVVVRDLYSRYLDVTSLAAANAAGIERIVKPCDLRYSKTRGISVCMKILYEEYGDNVPDSFDTLLKSPRVGRKSVNLIMEDVLDEPAIVTGTHYIRLIDHIGLVDDIKDPKKVEMALWKLMPAQEGSDFCHRSVYHGRNVYMVWIEPYCEKCYLEDICAKAGVTE